MRLPELLHQLDTMHRQRFEIEQDIARVEQQIVTASKGEQKPRRRKRALRGEMLELVKDLVKVLHDAGQPLPRREIAARLGLTPTAVGYRLQKAMAAKFVERVSGGRYRATNVVPVF